MKKIVSIILCVALMVTFAGCGNKTDESSTGYYAENEIDGYVKPDYNTYNTPAKENNLGGTKIYVDGVFEEIIDNATILAKLDNNGEKWMVGLAPNTDVTTADFEKFLNKKVRIFGVYNGQSGKYNCPVIASIKFSFPNTGECHHITEYFATGMAFFEGFESSYINGSKELNGNYVAPTPTPTPTPEPTSTPATKEYNSYKISLSEYSRLTTGMSYSKVVEIIGSSGELLSESSIGGITAEVYSWDGEGSLGANANIVFSNGKLQSKAQYGLE